MIYNVVGHVYEVFSSCARQGQTLHSQPNPYKALVGCNTHGNCEKV